MGIYIKGMELPKTCEGCRMYDTPYVSVDGLCHAADKWLDDPWFVWHEYEEGDIDTSKPLNCPLTEVPEPHGRLVDVDAIFDEMRRYSKVIFDTGFLLSKANKFEKLNGLLDDAPTVIERSE